MLGAETLRPGSFGQHLIARKHKMAMVKRTLMVALTLTAMVDMFAVLVIFLLQSFSASPELIVTKGVQLPAASTGAEIQDAPVLALVSGEVFLDQKSLGKTEIILRHPKPLMVALRKERESWQKAHPKEDFPGELHLQADRNLRSTLVGRMMGIVSQAHYNSIQLAVLGEGK